MFILEFLIVSNGFEIERDGAEAVVTGNHGRIGILHPSIIEIALATGQSLDKGAHRFPCALAQAVGALRVTGDTRLSQTDVTSVLDGILVLLHEVMIDRLPHGRDAHRAQGIVFLIIVHERKDTKNPPKHKTRRETFYQAPRLYR